MKPIQVIAMFFVLLTGGWSSVLAATFCPHVKASSCCLMMSNEHNGEHAMTHEGMAMGDMQMPSNAAPDSEVKGPAFEQPLETCAHCVGHSGIQTAPVVLGGAEQTRRDAHITAPPASISLALQNVPLAAIIPNMPHAPPGAKFPRHVLINIFRI